MAGGYRRSTSNVSVHRVIQNVNAENIDLLKYLPETMLNEQQGVARRNGIEKTEKYTREKNNSKYAKAAAKARKHTDALRMPAKLLDIVKDDSTRRNGAAVLYELVNIYEKNSRSTCYHGESKNPQRRQNASTNDTISQPAVAVKNVSLRTDDTRPYCEKRKMHRKELPAAPGLQY